MRVTLGKSVRKYVYDVQLDGCRVRELWMDGRKVWPTLADTARKCVLDVAAVEGTEDWAYWLHALDAVGRFGAGAERYVRLRAGGREYMLGGTFGRWTLAGYDGRATVDFWDNGPLMERLREGDEVEARLVVPDREAAALGTAEQNQSASGTVALPWLPGAGLRVQVVKWRKKSSARCDFAVTGVPSGTVHVRGFAQKNGHRRGEYWGSAHAKPMGVINGWVEEFCDAIAPGDTGLAVEAGWSNAGSGRVVPVFPRFDRVVRFRVAAVIRHD